MACDGKPRSSQPTTAGQGRRRPTARLLLPLWLTGLAVLASAQNPAVSSIAAGDYHTCAATAVGGVKCWGFNGAGQLGNSTVGFSGSPIPVNAVGLTTPAAGIVAGGANTCVLTPTSGVKCWGANQLGELGNGANSDSSVAGSVAFLTSGVSSLSTGSHHSCVVRTGGAKCWGHDSVGQLGDGAYGTDSNVPVDVVGLASGVSGIVAGGNHSCAIVNGGVKCWGLAFGVNSAPLTPQDVVGLATGVSSIAAGSGHTCAVTTSGGVKCWGYNNYGQLGNGTHDASSVPVDVVGLTTGAVKIATGFGHTCAVMTSGGVKCWGARLRNGSDSDTNTPTDVSGLSGVSSISAGFLHTCALTTGGAVKCWGYNGNGQLGNGAMTDSSTPVNVLTAPTLAAPSSASIAPARATLGGAVTADGGSAITGRGVVYSQFGTNTNPQIGGMNVTQVSTASTDSVFTVGVTSLIPLTLYAFKAYATNAVGTSYTAVATFTTPVPASRVFVSSSGHDVNACADQTAPCRNLAEGLDQVAADGEVIVLTPGEYETAPLVITKGVRLTSPSGTVAFVRQPIVLNAPGGRIVLRGLTLKGAGGGDGITLTAADSLSIEETTIDRWGNGLSIAPGSASFVSVTNSIFIANSVGLTLPSGGTNRVSIEGARFEGNGTGLSALSGAFAVRESSFVGHATTGITIGPGSIDIQRSEFSLNTTGVSALSGGMVRIGRSRVFGNTTGLSAEGGSTFVSSGRNAIRGNTANTSGTITTTPEG